MPTRLASSFSARKIARNRGERLAAVLLALLLIGYVVGTPAQERHKKPTHAGSADLAFEPLDPDEAAAARATAVYEFAADNPAADLSNMTETKIPGNGTAGKAAPYPLNIAVAGFSGVVGRVTVRLHDFTHSCPKDVGILLVGPKGQKVTLMSGNANCLPVENLFLAFDDNFPKVPDSQLEGGWYSPTSGDTSSLPPPAPAAPYSTTLSSFVGTDPNGTWSLFVIDRAQDDVGTLWGFTLMISPQFSNNTPQAIPDCTAPACPPGPVAAIESAINVAGLPGRVGWITVSFHITHSWDADLDISLIGPDNTTVPLVEDRGGIAGKNFGTSCANRTVLQDVASTHINSASPPFVGVFQPESPLFAFYDKTGAAANGVWKLRIKDDVWGDVGTLQCWSIAFTADNVDLQSPTGLRVASIVGNEVTLRWTGPAAGDEPDGYVLEGGRNPGETLASIATNNRAYSYTFVAPTGSFYVRARATSRDQIGPPSNEVPLHVNVPVPPSPPGLLQGVVNGSTLALAWRTTFRGAAPSSYILDVSGDANASIPLPATDNITFTGVPAGTYELRLRAANDGGVSEAGLTANDGYGGSTSPLRLTFPSACSGEPNTPSSFLAYQSGNTIYVMWEPSLAGWAPTEYVLNVDGAFVGSFTTTARALKGAVGPGTYKLTVAASNPCGMSPASREELVIVP